MRHGEIKDQRELTQTNKAIQTLYYRSSATVMKDASVMHQKEFSVLLFKSSYRIYTSKATQPTLPLPQICTQKYLFWPLEITSVRGAEFNFFFTDPLPAVSSLR